MAACRREKIEVFGFPVQWRYSIELTRKFENSLPDLTATGGRPRLLYVINSARKKAPKLLDRLLEHVDWDVTVRVGRDTDLDEMAREKAATAPGRMEVVGYTHRMSQLLREHHAVISRAEAGMVQEAIAARCPMMCEPCQLRAGGRKFEPRCARPMQVCWRRNPAR